MQHRQVGIQGVVLEHQPHPPLLGRELGHVLVAEENPATGGGLQAGNHIQCGALAAARGAQQANELAIRNFIGKIIHRHGVRPALLPGREYFGEILQNDFHCLSPLFR